MCFPHKRMRDMEIIVKTRNNNIKIINEFELEAELSKIISIKGMDISEVLYKLKRGDLLGFNDVYFKKKD